MVLMDFIRDNWGIISLVSISLIQVANTITKHFSNYSGLAKAMLVLTELLSFLTSKDVKDSVFKLPATSKKPSEV